MTKYKISHPGKTAAQRRALDQIGCGNFSPVMAKATRDAMLRTGIIIHAGDKIIGKDIFGSIKIAEFAMPISVHMQWCAAMAQDYQDEIDIN